MGRTIVKTIIKPTNKVGRHSIMTPNVLRKLKDAYLEGASDELACQTAKISPTALYNNLKMNEELRSEIHAWKHMIRHKAIKKIYKAIKDPNSGTEDAWKWLEKKYPQEFSASPQSLVQINSNTQTNYIEFIEEDKNIVP